MSLVINLEKVNEEVDCIAVYESPKSEEEYVSNNSPDESDWVDMDEMISPREFLNINEK